MAADAEVEGGGWVCRMDGVGIIFMSRLKIYGGADWWIPDFYFHHPFATVICHFSHTGRGVDHFMTKTTALIVVSNDTLIHAILSSLTILLTTEYFDLRPVRMR